MRSIALNKSVSGVLNASGAATLTLGPARYGVMWRVRNATVSVAQKQVQPLTPTAQLFYSGNMIGGTFSGAQDTFSDMNQDMHPGELITAKWTGGDPGDTATLSVFGTQEIP